MKELCNLNNIPNEVKEPIDRGPYIQRKGIWTYLTFDNGHGVRFCEDASTSMIFTFSDADDERCMTRRTADQFLMYMLEVSRRPNSGSYC